MRINEMNIVDFHAHILPCADHGSSSVEESVKQLTLAKKYGVEYIVATPHFYPDRESAKNFLARRDVCTERLRALLSDAHIPVYLGTEMQATEGIDHMKELDALCIGGTNVLLLEMPFYAWSEALFETVERLCRMPYRVVLAHVNRYREKDVRRLLMAGARAQLNAEAVGGICLSRRYRRMVEEGMAVALGSDLHLLQNYREKHLLRTVERYSSDAFASLRRASEMLLDGASPLL